MVQHANQPCTEFIRGIPSRALRRFVPLPLGTTKGQMTDHLDRLTAALADRYSIERQLGVGGMATVYLAEDLKHKRKVAVKVLRPELAAVLGAERFVQEITTTANLQHPHILPLFDSGEADGFLYYVMPYIEGETLRDKLNRESQLSIDEAVRITTDVADALDYAHSNNVIHRDIKPENILLHNGRPMVADFGIALAVSAAAGGRMTETGLSLGTPHYMSPEQATAEKDLTNRSDIYSLGCVLYEMLTGEPPHTGASAQAIVMKIVTEDVRPVTELRKSVPRNVAAATAKTLEKLAADRFESAAKFAEALTNPAFTLPSMEPRPGGSGGGRSRVWLVLPWAVAATTVGILLARGPAASTDAPRSWNIALPDSFPMVFVGEGTFGLGYPALDISPDGSLIVYVGQIEGTTQLFVRPTDGFDVRALPGTTGAFHPFFSPSGQEIAFFADDQLKRVPVEGGDVLVVTDAPNAAGGSWSEDDEIVVSIQDGSAVIVVRPNGLERRVFAGFGNGSPQWLPGGEWVLQTCDFMFLCVFVPDRAERRFLTANGGAVSSLAEGAVLRGNSPRYLPNGYLVYGGPGQNVAFAVRFDPGTLTTSGQPTQVLGGLRREAFSGALHVAASLDGTLVFAGGIDAALGELVWVDGDGVEETLPFSAQLYGGFSLSPDGNRVAAPVTTGAGVRQLWFLDLRRTRHQVWAGDYSALNTRTWDSTSRFTYATFGDEKYRIIRIDADAASGGDAIYEGEEHLSAQQVLSDGRLLIERFRGRSDLWLVDQDDLADANGIEEVGSLLVPLEGEEVFGALSPDERWLTYTSNATGRHEVYALVYPIEESPRPIPLSRDGGVASVWSPRGDGLYYRNARRWYWVPLTDSAAQPFGELEFFAEGEYLVLGGLDHAVSPDGSRILVVRSVGKPTTTTLNVVTNWFEELKAKVGN